MDVATATASYERWLGRFFALHAPDVDYKHARMSDPDDPFPFFRGTYFLWAALWPEVCPEEADPPPVLAVGDLHVENFGTWRDADGRLCWGVNDFDEADELPYTNDLVRLAASTQVARATGRLDIKLGWACRAILTGYRDALESGGIPFVLEERHPELRAMAMAAERNPVRFWTKLTRVLNDPPAEPPRSAAGSRFFATSRIRDILPNCDSAPKSEWEASASPAMSCLPSGTAGGSCARRRRSRHRQRTGSKGGREGVRE